MGLSGRKEKQHIPADPRNLAWADDAAKFGSNYLSKFGWDSSQGLGIAGDGRTSHIKVSQKLDMLGIGAAHRMDPNGTAWKQNKDFENLLKRLNDAARAEESKDKAEEASQINGSANPEKKRKRNKDRDEAPGEKRKKRKSSEEDDRSDKTTGEAEKNAEPYPGNVKNTAAAEPVKPYIPRHRAHRARAIASKNITSKSAAAIAEILGIASIPSSSVTTSSSGTPNGKLTSLDDDVILEKLTTSTKSVADYFKDKLMARSSNKSGSATPVTPRSEAEVEEDSRDTSRRGLGSSRLQLDTRRDTPDRETQKIGISKFSSLMSSTLLATSPSSPTVLELPGTMPELSEQRAETQKEPSGDSNIQEGCDAKKKKKRKGKKEKPCEEAEIVSPEPIEARVHDDSEKTRVKEARRREKAERRALKGKNLL